MPRLNIKPHDPDRLVHCPFPKWQGVSWDDVLSEDSRYIEWLISGAGPKLDDELYDFLVELLEQ